MPLNERSARLPLAACAGLTLRNTFMQAVVERAARSGESEVYVARSVGRTTDGAIAAAFEVTWSFKRRA